MLMLIEFHENCGRMGSLDGKFIVTQEEFDQIMGKNVYLGEVLGKHSDVSVDITPENFKVINQDQVFLQQVIDNIGWCLGGTYPFDYLENDE